LIDMDAVDSFWLALLANQTAAIQVNLAILCCQNSEWCPLSIHQAKPWPQYDNFNGLWAKHL